jgi:hypothetical protein
MPALAAAIAWLTGGNLIRLAATLLAGIAIGGWGAWQVQGWRQASADLARERAAHAQFRVNERTAQAASTTYQQESANARIQYRTRWRTVETLVDRPVYRNVCLDADGLRELNAAIAGDQPASR